MDPLPEFRSLNPFPAPGIQSVRPSGPSGRRERPRGRPDPSGGSPGPWEHKEGGHQRTRLPTRPSRLSGLDGGCPASRHAQPVNHGTSLSDPAATQGNRDHREATGLVNSGIPSYCGPKRAARKCHQGTQSLLTPDRDPDRRPLWMDQVDWSGHRRAHTEKPPLLHSSPAPFLRFSRLLPRFAHAT
jgi:hypothetical protein